MAASVPIALEGLKERVEDYRDRLASLGRAMSSLQHYADDLLAAIERDCLELQAARSQAAAAEDAITAIAQPDVPTEAATEANCNCPAHPTPADHLSPTVGIGPTTPLATIAPTCPDDFTLIKGIDPATAQSLAGIGLTTFAELAGLYQEDVEEIGSMLADRRRISRECWIEQAAILAAGHSTAYVRQMFSAVDGTDPAGPLPASIAAATECDWAPCFAPLRPDALPATGPDFTISPTIGAIDIEDQLAEARAAVARSRRLGPRQKSSRSSVRQRAREQTLARHRSVPRAAWKLAVTSAAALTLAVISSSLVASDALQSDLAARLTRLSTCTVDSISTDQDCAVLAWLLL